MAFGKAAPPPDFSLATPLGPRPLPLFELMTIDYIDFTGEEEGRFFSIYNIGGMRTLKVKNHVKCNITS